MIRTQSRTKANVLWTSLAAGAASGALFASSLWVPLLGFLFSLVSPLPLALETGRRGLTGASLATAGGLLTVWILSGPVGGAVYLTQFAAGGCLLGWASRRGLPPAATIGAYTAVTVCAFWGSAMWLAAQQGLDLRVFLDRTVARSLEEVTTRLLQGEADARMTAAVQTWAEQTRNIVLRTYPALFTILALGTGWGNVLVLRRITGVSAEDSWIRWRAPESWIWALIGSGLLAALAPEPWSTIALNGFLVISAVYFLVGLAIVQFLFESKGFPRLFRVAAYLLLLVQLPVALIVAALGAFDLWFDFRSRLEPPKDEDPQQS